MSTISVLPSQIADWLSEQTSLGGIRFITEYPAVKKEIPRVRGLLAKGNIKVDMTWSGGKLTSYSLTGNGEAHIVYGGQETVHRLDGGTLTVEL